MADFDYVVVKHVINLVLSKAGVRILDNGSFEKTHDTAYNAGRPAHIAVGRVLRELLDRKGGKEGSD